MAEREADQTPVVDAYRLSDTAQCVMWCPWCQSRHVHGDGGGQRAAHCMVSPCGHYSLFHRTGYDLNVKGEIQSVDALYKMNGPFSDKINLDRRLVIDNGAYKLKSRPLAKTLFKRIFPSGRASTANGCWTYQGHGVRLSVLCTGEWNAVLSDGEHAEGRDMLDMLDHLFGIPPEVAVVRIIEAATGARIEPFPFCRR